MKGDPRHSSRILDSIPDHLSVEFSGGSRGRARGSPPAPPLFLDQTEARRAEKIFLETAPLPHLSQGCLLYTSPSPRDGLLSRMPSSA